MLNEIGGLAAGLAQGINMGMQWNNMKEQQKLQKRQMDRLEKGDVRDTEKHDIEMDKEKFEKNKRERYQTFLNHVSNIGQDGQPVASTTQNAQEQPSMEAPAAPAPTPSSIQLAGPIPDGGLAMNAPAAAASPFSAPAPDGLRPAPVQAAPKPQQPQMTGSQKVAVQIASGQFGFTPQKMKAIGELAMQHGFIDEANKYFTGAQDAEDKGYLRAARSLMRGNPQAAADAFAAGGIQLESMPVKIKPDDQNDHNWTLNVKGVGEKTVDVRHLLQSTIDPDKVYDNIQKEKEFVHKSGLETKEDARKEREQSNEDKKTVAEVATQGAKRTMYLSNAGRADRMPAGKSTKGDIKEALADRSKQFDLHSTEKDEAGKQAVNTERRQELNRAAYEQSKILERTIGRKLDADEHREVTDAMLDYPKDTTDRAAVRKWQGEFFDRMGIDEAEEEPATVATADKLGKGERRAMVETPKTAALAPAKAEPTREEKELHQVRFSAEDSLRIKKLQRERTASNLSAKERKAVDEEIAALLTKHAPKAGLKTAARGRAPSSDPEAAPAGYGKRQDGTDKGTGWLGVHKSAKGNDMTEYTVGLNIGGKDVDVPTFVPGLTKDELAHLKTEPDLSKRTAINESILKKAAAHAKKRMAEGKSVFADQQVTSK